MADSLDTISSATGIKRAELQAIWAEVKANGGKLDGCQYHDFVLIPGTDAPMKRRYVCSNCGGEVDGIAYRWHQDGRRPRP